MPRKDADLVLYSWKRIGAAADRAAGIFYDRLFEIAPASQAHLSAEQMPASRRSLMTRIDWAISGYLLPGESAEDRDPPPPVHGAPRDPFLGATAEHAVAALLGTLQSVLGAEWTPRHEAAWNEAGPAIVAALRPGPLVA